MSGIVCFGEEFCDLDWEDQPLEKGEYEGTIFKTCNFQRADLSGYRFVDCEFIGCNLSLVQLHDTSLQNVHFKGCKMMGINFMQCNRFGLALSFDGCQLNSSSFFDLSLSETSFVDSELRDVSFGESNFSKSIFKNCDFQGADFLRVNLQKADFRSSYNYTIDPEINKVRGAQFSIWGTPGLLGKYGLKIEL